MNKNSLKYLALKNKNAMFVFRFKICWIIRSDGNGWLVWNGERDMVAAQCPKIVDIALTPYRPICRVS